MRPSRTTLRMVVGLERSVIEWVRYLDEIALRPYKYIKHEQCRSELRNN